MRKLFAILISIFFLLLDGFLLYQINQNEAISFAYKIIITFIVIIIASVLSLIYLRTQFKLIKTKMSPKEKKKIKINRLTSSLMMIVLSFILAFVNNYYFSINHMVSNITNYSIEEEPKINCNIYALNKSSIDSLGDNSIKKIGILSRENGVVKSPVKQLIKKEYNRNPDVYSYPTSVDLFNALEDKQMDLIIISKEEVSTMQQYISNFDTKVKLIGSIELGTAVESKPVNVTTEPFNVLILGVDIRQDEGTIRTDTRTDTVMVASFNPITMEVALISIPRDGYVEINGSLDKMTHAGNSGLQTVVATVEELLDIEINYFAKFNFNALVKLIDAIGGINITVDYPFCEQDSNDTPNAICLEKGLQHLNGEQALAYARHRKTVGDSMRNHAQQQVIAGITNQLISFSILTKFDNITSVLSNNMLTNFTRKELYTLASLTPNLGSLTFHNYVITGVDDSTYIKKYNQTMAIVKIDKSSLTEAKKIITNIQKSSNE